MVNSEFHFKNSGPDRLLCRCNLTGGTFAGKSSGRKSQIWFCSIPAGRWLRILQLTSLVLLAGYLRVSASGSFQTITVSGKDAPLEKILASIEKQTSFTFVYSANLLVKGRPVSVDIRNADLESVLDSIFSKQPFAYKIFSSSRIIALRFKEQAKLAEIAPVPVEESDELIDVIGKVVNVKGDPVIEGTIAVVGTTRGTLTDQNGVFFLPKIKKNATIKISSIGYEDETIALGGKTAITAVLQIRTNELDELHVVAYGNRTKREELGTVSTLRAKDIQGKPVSNPLLAMQGELTGAVIVQKNGLPGSGISFIIRGGNSITNGNDPLFIIDGVNYPANNLPSSVTFVLSYSNSTTGNPLNYINPADIESISVLKDAEATAIYGTRGANGVVIITTKKGKAGSLNVDINIQKGWGEVARKMKLLNTRQYLDMRYEAFRNDGATPNPNADYDLTLWDTTRNTDWQKELIGGKANYTDMQVAASGGNSNARYRVGMSYHKETTVFPGNLNDRKGTVHFNLNGTSPDSRLNLLFSGFFAKDINQLSSYDLTEQAIKLPPNAPALYNSDGSINWAPNAAGVTTWPFVHPASMLLIKFKSQTSNLVGNAVVSYKAFEGVELKSSFGYNRLQARDIQTIPLVSQDPSQWLYAQRRSTFVNNDLETWIVEPQVHFDYPVLKGNLSALVGATVQQSMASSQSIDARGFNSDLLLEDITSASSLIVYPTGTSTYTYKYGAVFGRINYNWDKKYLINFTARRDGTSRFGPANRFHNFGAVAVGWIFSEEKLVNTLLPFISFGKIRSSYGTTGSDQVGDYTYMDLYRLSNQGVPYQGVNGASPSRIYTPDLAWEKTNKLEAAIELGLFNNRIFFNASFYQNRSSNQLVDYSLPAITGFTSVKKNLNAVVQNRGWEFELRTTNIRTSNFQWTSFFNLSTNKNKLLSGAEGLSSFYQQRIGYPTNAQLVYNFAGVDLITGLYRVNDVNGKPTETPNPATDATTLVDLTPRFYGGFKNSLSIGNNFQLDFLFQFVRQPQAGVYLYNYIPGFFGSLDGSNQPVSVLGRWQKPGDVSAIQRFSQNSSTLKAREIAQFSNQSYGDASFIRFKNISLSYSLPSGWTRTVSLNSARVYMQAQNLFTITRYQGLDPETRRSVSLPPLRVITFGIQIVL